MADLIVSSLLAGPLNLLITRCSCHLLKVQTSHWGECSCMWVYLIQTFSTSHTYKALFTHFKLLKHSSKTHFPKELSWLGNTCLLLLTAKYFVLHCLMLQLPANLLNPFQWVWQTHGPHPARARACMLKLLQSCATLCDPMDCNPLGSSVHGILQARILEWVAMPSSGSSWPRDWTHISYIYLQASGLTEFIPLLCTSAIWGQILFPCSP